MKRNCVDFLKLDFYKTKNISRQTPDFYKIEFEIFLIRFCLLIINNIKTMLNHFFIKNGSSGIQVQPTVVALTGKNAEYRSYLIHGEIKVIIATYFRTTKRNIKSNSGQEIMVVDLSVPNDNDYLYDTNNNIQFKQLKNLLNLHQWTAVKQYDDAVFIPFIHTDPSKEYEFNLFQGYTCPFISDSEYNKLKEANLLDIRLIEVHMFEILSRKNKKFLEKLFLSPNNIPLECVIFLVSSRRPGRVTLFVQNSLIFLQS